MLLIPLLALAVGHPPKPPALPAVDLETPSTLRFRFEPAGGADVRLVRAERHDEESEPVFDLAALQTASTFGQQGTLRLNVHGGFGLDIKTSDNRQGHLGVGLSYFLIDNLSFDVELNGMYVDQRGDDAWGANLNLLFRWHFLARDTWSLYFDGGAGMLGTTDHVPSSGSGFNFTPQAGLGVSFDLGEDVRMMTGVRWHHISNANTFNRNPGRDNVLGYVGVSVPF